MKHLLERDKIQYQWSFIQNSIGLKLPKLVKLDLNNNKEKKVNLFGITIYERPEAITNHDVKKLIDWIISINHKDLIKISQITNRFEAERIITGIISSHIGIPINEMK